MAEDMKDQTKTTLSVVISAIAIAGFAMGGPLFVAREVSAAEEKLSIRMQAVSGKVTDLEKAVMRNTILLENEIPRVTRKDLRAWVEVLRAKNPEIQVPPFEDNER